jgi:hypothetical protein
MDDTLKSFRPRYAPDGMVFATRDEDQLYRVCVWATDEGFKKYHLITEERAQEIIDEYKRKYGVRR